VPKTWVGTGQIARRASLELRCVFHTAKGIQTEEGGPQRHQNRGFGHGRGQQEGKSPGSPSVQATAPEEGCGRAHESECGVFVGLEGGERKGLEQNGELTVGTPGPLPAPAS